MEETRTVRFNEIVEVYKNIPSIKPIKGIVLLEPVYIAYRKRNS